MNKKIEVKILTENEYPIWKSFTGLSEQSTIYSDPDYLDILCSVTGGKYHIAAVLSGEEIQAGVPVYEEHRPDGHVMANRLLLYYNGPVLKTFESKYPSVTTSKQSALLSALADYLNKKNYDRTIMNCFNLQDIRPFLSAGWSARPSYTYLVDISSDEDCHGRIEQNLRRLIKRCSESDFTFTDDNDFDSFFEQHLEIHQRKNAPLYLEKDPYRKYFEQLYQKKMCRLFHARDHKRESTASQLVLTGSDNDSYTVCAAAKEEFLNQGTTPYLRWKVFEQLSKENYVFNDLTDAAPNPVTRFKSQLGGDLTMNMVVQRPDSAEAQRRLNQSGGGGLMSIPKRIIKKVIGR